ncbi:hypothetical protein SprV_0602150000 [Sparganum proliferum]
MVSLIFVDSANSSFWGEAQCQTPSQTVDRSYIMNVWLEPPQKEVNKGPAIIHHCYRDRLTDDMSHPLLPLLTLRLAAKTSSQPLLPPRPRRVECARVHRRSGGGVRKPRLYKVAGLEQKAVDGGGGGGVQEAPSGVRAAGRHRSVAVKTGVPCLV